MRRSSRPELIAEGESIPLEVRTVVGVIVRTATGVDSHGHWVVSEGHVVEEGGNGTIEEGAIFSLSTM